MSRTELDTELSETTAAVVVDEHLVDEHPVPPAVEQLLAEARTSTSRSTRRTWPSTTTPATSMRTRPAAADGAADGFGQDLSDGRLGAALVFATVSLIGIGLGSFASLLAAPTLVIVAVWGIAALAGLLALRELTRGGAR